MWSSALVTDEELQWCSRLATISKLVAVFTFLLAGVLALMLGVPAFLVSTQTPLGLVGLLPVALFVVFIGVQASLVRQAGKALGSVEGPEDRVIVDQALTTFGTLFKLEGVAFWGVIALSVTCVCVGGGLGG